MADFSEEREYRVCKNRFVDFEKFLKKWDSEHTGKVVLDAGAGPQRYRGHVTRKRYISHHLGQYKGGGNALYYDQEVCTDWRGSECDIISDITEIPVEDDSFDLVILTEVLEHVYSPERALIELARVLKTGGTIAITMPYACHYHQEPYYFNAGLSYHFFYEFFTRHNFNIQDCALEGDFRSFMQWENKVMGLMQRNIFLRFAMRAFGLVTSLFYFCCRFLSIEQPKFHSGILVVAIKQ
jgi:SAM-dependent methyltransferase